MFSIDSDPKRATFHDISMRRVLAVALGLALLTPSGWCAEAQTGPEKNLKGDEITIQESGKIAQVVGQLLQRAHYKQAPLNDETSKTFLKNYFNALDYNHLIFLQSDIEEFEQKYATSLDDRTQQADTAAAFEIYDRYIQRLDERRILVEKLVKQEHDFTKDETFSTARNKAPFPKDEAEAAELWRLRIKFELLQSRLNKEKPEEAADVIARRYARLEKTMKSFGREDILQMYLTALANAYDPHSDYFSPSEAKNFDIQHISLSLSGIGATLEWDDGYTKIKSLVPGGPADLSKQLKPGDKIVSVAQGSGEPVDVVEMRLNKVVELIRGKRGTEVRLTVIPAKAPDTKKVITITRDEIKLQEQYAKARVVEQVGADGKTHRLGVITLPQFYDDCSAHVEKLIGRLKKENIDGLVLDLRKNGGGILDEAISLTGLFIKKGPVVQVKDSRKQIQVMKDDNSKIAYDGPLVVMTSRLSASASEIVAAALQDYGRALVIGDQATHGKGTVQTVLGLDSFIRKDDVPNPGKLKLTVSKFYRVEGGTTQREGVTPDIVLPSVYDYLELGESSIENALPADRINPVSHERVGKVTSAWEQELQSKSRERIKEDRDFEYLFEDIAQVKKQQADKTVSLNEQKRLAEKEEQKAKMEARKKERAARKVEGEKVFELTLEMVDKNGAMQQVAALNAKQDDNLAATKVETPDDPSALEEEDESGNAPDPHLNEGLHILSDYAALLASSERRLADTAAATK